MRQRDLIAAGADRPTLGHLVARCKCMSGIRDSHGQKTEYPFEVGCFLILGHFFYQLGFPITEASALVDYFSGIIRFERDRPDDGVILISPGGLSGKKSTGLPEVWGRHLATGEGFKVEYPHTMMTYFFGVMPSSLTESKFRVRTLIDIEYIRGLALEI